MKCFICGQEYNSNANYSLSTLLLLGYQYVGILAIDMRGKVFNYSYLFTPLGKKTFNGFYCKNCISEINIKNKNTKKISRILLSITLVIAIVLNYLSFSNTVEIPYLFFIDTAIVIILFFSIIFSLTKTEDKIKEAFLKSEELKEEIPRLIKKVDLKSIPYLNLSDDHKDNFKENNLELVYNEKDLRLVDASSRDILDSTAIGNDGSRDWFQTYPSKSQITSSLKYSTIWGGYYLNLEYVALPKGYKGFSKKDSYKLSQSKMILEL